MNKMKLVKKNIMSAILIVFVFCLPVLSMAQAPNTGKVFTKITNPIKANNINDLIKVILEGVIKIGMPIVALAIIYAGFLFVTAQGKPADIEKAQSALLNAVIGAAVLFGAWSIAQIITETVKAL